MICTHGTPGGARYCGLCRYQVLAEAEQLPDRLRRRDDTRGAPPPPDFWDRVRAAQQEAHRDQPRHEQATLDLEDT